MRTLVLLLTWIALWPLAFVSAGCATNERVVMVKDGSGEQEQHGGAGLFHLGHRKPWPQVKLNNVKYRLIKYCYSGPEARNALHCSHVMPALTVWGNKLGTPASAKTGHSLAWHETHDDNPDPKKRVLQYCHTPDGNWNPKVPGDALMISIYFQDPGLALSSIGYSDSSESTTPGRNFVKIGLETNLSDAVHEFGHVLGLVHEVHRSDRDDYVLYQCKHVIGYQDCLDKAMAAEKMSQQDASAKLCEDFDFATKYNFFGTQFLKSPGGENVDQGNFDLDSIMLYHSLVMSNSICVIDMHQCPLLQYKKEGGKTAGLERIPPRDMPSAGDIALVKKWYPWED
ncbi:hypothetical protein C7974DRAFT_456032 [Boeremia exigua]|uniref:uncharacterized protein n=1 Tax=Boeremia exigua TaxID=749465 RepID=UPI001E8EEFE6|nr:uncharacterized protein C7974DRAFT_456032 [Boeremia exigua]KAH6625713.1 hypothetical protein C7974DRAFT_456032 [Boeremia exigua]